MTLDEKQAQLDGLVNVIELRNRLLSAEERAKMRELQDRMEFRLQALFKQHEQGIIKGNEARHRELDIKLEIYKEIIDLAKYEEVAS